MYIPKYYEEKDWAEIENLIREFGFATLVSESNGVPLATHIPLELSKNEDGDWILMGHGSRANQQLKSFEAGKDVLAIFMGPHAYISPSWYNHKNVPTWNYMAIHAYGKVRILEGEELKSGLRKMMARYENLHAENPIKMDEVPDKILETDFRGLIAFEIKVERFEANSKLSQTRDAESYQGIIDHLKKSDDYDSKRIAEEMEKRKK